MKPPCMVVVKYILPSIRAMVARSLVEEYNMKPIKVASKMDITPAAVTQYLKEARGTTAVGMIVGSEEVVKIVSEIADNLAKDEYPIHDILQNICKVCWTLRSEGLICELHKDILPALKDIPKHKCPIPF